MAWWGKETGDTNCYMMVLLRRLVHLLENQGSRDRGWKWKIQVKESSEERLWKVIFRFHN